MMRFGPVSAVTYAAGNDLKELSTAHASASSEQALKMRPFNRKDRANLILVATRN
jgi:hypothetical protein